MLKIAKVEINHFHNPIGISGMPKFTWIIESNRKNVLQGAYHLVVAKDDIFQEIVFDSGWVVSDASANVSLEEGQLQGENVLSSCSKYYVKVRIRDWEEESEFSDSAFFITALIDHKEWIANFISAETKADKDNSKSTYLRNKILVKEKVKEAIVCTTSLGLYHFYINGNKVENDQLAPGWTSYYKHLCYQTYEVTDLLQEGENTLSALVGAGWYKGKMGFLLQRNNYGEQTAFLMQMVIRYQDGHQEQFITSNEWKGADGPVIFSEIYDGEHYDSRMEIPEWNTNLCDDTLWKNTEHVSFPFTSLTPQAGCKVTTMEKFSVKEMIKTPKGEVVLDFGQNMSGWIQFCLTGVKEDASAMLQCFEALDADGNVYIENLRSAKQQIKYICKGTETEVYQPFFTFQGFRYAKIIEWPCEVKKENFTAYALYSKMEQTGTFSCSNPLVNQLQQNILWGLKSNFVDIPTDCPQRDERMGWTGDAQIFCRTSCYLMNTYPFFEKWLKDVAADQTKEGGVPHVVPDIISDREHKDWLLSQGTHSAAAWADVAVINPWTLYLVYGDSTILETQYQSMKKWIQFMQKHAVDFIWNYKLQFGDWVALDAEEGSYFGATPNDLTCTAYFAYSAGIFAKIAKILGQVEDAELYHELCQQVTKKFQESFFDNKGFMTAQTQTAHIVALYFNLTPKKYQTQTAAQLVKLLEKENNHLVTGFIGTPYFCHALSQNGYVKEAYALLQKEDFPSWLYQIKMGATTIWEHWDGLKPDGTMWSAEMNSFNHYAYGAIGDWLYRVVLGIEVDEEDPGYHHSRICPQTGNSFSFAEGSYLSVYGEINVSWKKGTNQSRRILQVKIPHNTRSSIILEEGASLIDAQGLIFEEIDGKLTTVCGSGIWSIQYEINERIR